MVSDNVIEISSSQLSGEVILLVKHFPINIKLPNPVHWEYSELCISRCTISGAILQPHFSSSGMLLCLLLCFFLSAYGLNFLHQTWELKSPTISRVEGEATKIIERQLPSHIHFFCLLTSMTRNWLRGEHPLSGVPTGKENHIQVPLKQLLKDATLCETASNFSSVQGKAPCHHWSISYKS